MLSVRAYNALKRSQVNAVADLMGFTYEDLMEIDDLASVRSEEVMRRLQQVGICIPKRSNE